MVVSEILVLLAVAAATGARTQDPDPFDLLGSLVVRPPKVVVQAVRSQAPEYFWNTPKALRHLGYPVEEHRVRTDDGYLLTLHRIPTGRSTAEDNSLPGQQRPAVLLQHGAFGRSDHWVLAGPGVSPGFILADNGYDVWMSNARGNHYGEKHENMTMRDPKFWQFSWHEIGMFDVPAAIDYVLQATGQPSLYYFGHSMGNTAFYVMASSKPEYNAKVRLQVALAPAVFFDGAFSPTLRFLNANSKYIKAVMMARPTYQVLPRSDATTTLAYLLCGERSLFNKMCAVMLTWSMGPMDLNNTTFVGPRIARSVSSTSILVPMHFTQCFRTGKFQRMDHGAAGNERVYGQKEPPEYSLRDVTAPVALFASYGDALVPPKGVERLANALPNVVAKKFIDIEFFNHMDFMSHKNVKSLLMDDILELMKKY